MKWDTFKRFQCSLSEIKWMFNWVPNWNNRGIRSDRTSMYDGAFVFSSWVRIPTKRHLLQLTFHVDESNEQFAKNTLEWKWWQIFKIHPLYLYCLFWMDTNLLISQCQLFDHLNNSSITYQPDCIIWLFSWTQYCHSYFVCNSWSWANHCVDSRVIYAFHEIDQQQWHVTKKTRSRDKW